MVGHNKRERASGKTGGYPIFGDEWDNSFEKNKILCGHNNRANRAGKNYLYPLYDFGLFAEIRNCPDVKSLSFAKGVKRS
jgi:hypothetical protein